MKLSIHNVSAADFGTYRGMAKNSQGQTTGDIEIYGKFSSLFTSNKALTANDLHPPAQGRDSTFS